MANFLKHPSVPTAQKMIPVVEVSLPLMTSTSFRVHERQKYINNISSTKSSIV